MAKLDINFVCESKRHPFAIRLALLLLGLSCLLWLGCQIRDEKAQVASLHAQQEAKQPISSQPKPSSANVELVHEVTQIQRQLSKPWLLMLASLEKIKARHPDIYVMEVTPNAAKSEVTLVVEARQFGSMADFLADLKSDAAFTDAVLQSQRMFEDQAEQMYNFNVVLTWVDNPQEPV